MPFLTLNNSFSNLAQYYNQVFNNKPEIPSLKYSAFDDGLIRGGVLNATLASVRDTGRIGKFLITGKGAIFNVKQLGLQKSNIPLEKDPQQLGSPTRTYNLGLNLLAQIPINVFGGHIIRHGQTPIGGVGFLEGNSLGVKGYSYERAVLNNNKKDTNTTIINSKPTNRLVNYLGKISFESVGNVQLDEYNGGANSVYGIGKTRITTTNITTNHSYKTSLNYRGISKYFDYYRDIVSAGSLEFPDTINNTGAALLSKIKERNNFQDQLLSSGVGVDDFDYGDTENSLVDKLNSDVSELEKKYNELKKKQTDNFLGENNADFITSVNINSYKTKNIQSQFGVSTSKYGPNNIKKDYKVDSINVIDITDSTTYLSNILSKKRNSEALTNISPDKVDGYYGKDIIKFVIEFLNNDSKGLDTDVLAFRAYIDDFNDGMNARWNTYRYMGRGEDFYVYDGFTRDIGVAFTIYAHSKEEIQPIYNKLNYLLSTFTPDYNEYNKMRGNIAYLTVGDYLVKQPGIFTDIKLSGMLDTHWEINLDNDTYQVPKHIKVNLTFKPIHTTLPRKVNRANPFRSNFVLPPTFQSTVTDKQKEATNSKNPSEDNTIIQQNIQQTFTNKPVDPEKLKDKGGKGKGK